MHTHEGELVTKCHRCNAGEFASTEHTAALFLFNPEEGEVLIDQETARVVPLVVFECNHCGFVALHSADKFKGES